jgi:hypothetical protein
MSPKARIPHGTKIKESRNEWKVHTCFAIQITSVLTQVLR